jgi:hypothetical protein
MVTESLTYILVGANAYSNFLVCGGFNGVL